MVVEKVGDVPIEATGSGFEGVVGDAVTVRVPCSGSAPDGSSQISDADMLGKRLRGHEEIVRAW